MGAVAWERWKRADQLGLIPPACLEAKPQAQGGVGGQGAEAAGSQPAGISGEVQQGTSLPNQHFPVWVVPGTSPTDLLLLHPHGFPHEDGETEAQPKGYRFTAPPKPS